MLIHNYKPNEHGTCNRLEYEKDGIKFSILWAYSSCYGEFVRQWIINGVDHVKKSTKYKKNDKVCFDCANSLWAGPFKNKSIVYETLVKPLGLENEWFDRRNAVGCRLIATLSKSKMEKYLIKGIL